MSEADLSAWCRSHGAYPQDLAKWRASAITALAEISLGAPGSPGTDTFRHRFDDLDHASAAVFSPMGETVYVAMDAAAKNLGVFGVYLFFLKTIIPSRKATRQFIAKEPDDVEAGSV